MNINVGKTKERIISVDDFIMDSGTAQDKLSFEQFFKKYKIDISAVGPRICLLAFSFSSRGTSNANDNGANIDRTGIISLKNPSHLDFGLRVASNITQIKTVFSDMMKIIGIIIPNSDASTILSDYSSLPCPLLSYGSLSSDIWSDSGIFEFENILVLRDNTSTLHSYLVEFEYNENIYSNKKVNGTNISMNDCNEGYFKIIDTSFSIESYTFSQNKGEFIFSISELIDTIDTIDNGNVHKLHVCFNEVSAIDDIGNAFLLLYNQNTHDDMYIIDINFNNADIRYNLYTASSLHALTTDSLVTGGDLFGGEITNITIYNSKFFNGSEFATAWITSDGDKYGHYVETSGYGGNSGNGNVGLDLPVSHCPFNTTGLIGHFASLTSVPTVAPRLHFDYNIFKNYATRHTNDYIFEFDNEGANVYVKYTSNQFLNVDVSTMTCTNGALSMWFDDMTIENDLWFHKGYDSLLISLNN